MDDRQEFLEQFLHYGHVLTAEEIEASGEEGVPHTPPTLDQYKEQVDTYEKIYNDVNESEVRKIKLGFINEAEVIDFDVCVLGNYCDRHVVLCGRTALQASTAQHYQEMELHVQASPHQPCHKQVNTTRQYGAPPDNTLSRVVHLKVVTPVVLFFSL